METETTEKKNPSVHSQKLQKILIWSIAINLPLIICALVILIGFVLQFLIIIALLLIVSLLFVAIIKKKRKKKQVVGKFEKDLAKMKSLNAKKV